CARKGYYGSSWFAYW
nr:immunoglobulin heavy chain junction region [Mus musculus]